MARLTVHVLGDGWLGILCLRRCMNANVVRVGRSWRPVDSSRDAYVYTRRRGSFHWDPIVCRWLKMFLCRGR